MFVIDFKILRGKTLRLKNIILIQVASISEVIFSRTAQRVLAS
jgi:hypothetical protein